MMPHPERRPVLSRAGRSNFPLGLPAKRGLNEATVEGMGEAGVGFDRPALVVREPVPRKDPAGGESCRSSIR